MPDDVEIGEAGGLAYRSAGSGRPLVLLHPGPGLDGSVFFPEALTLAQQGVRIVALDLPGNGRSPAVDRSTWSIAGYADACSAACARSASRPAHGTCSATRSGAMSRSRSTSNTRAS